MTIGIGHKFKKPKIYNHIIQQKNWSIRNVIYSTIVLYISYPKFELSYTNFREEISKFCIRHYTEMSFTQNMYRNVPHINITVDIYSYFLNLSVIWTKLN